MIGKLSMEDLRPASSSPPICSSRDGVSWVAALGCSPWPVRLVLLPPAPLVYWHAAAFPCHSHTATATICLLPSSKASPPIFHCFSIYFAKYVVIM